MSTLEIESRHSDWGEDAGGYSVLRFRGRWIGRVTDREAAKGLMDYVNALEVQNRQLREALTYLFRHAEERLSEYELEVADAALAATEPKP